ncbi:MAG: hypothetical protein GY761_02710, partial [Hyphomicrobiales bacterium]|nr:hypothetical protein [Hyphomicrobiales bacterium]
QDAPIRQAVDDPEQAAQVLEPVKETLDAPSRGAMDHMEIERAENASIASSQISKSTDNTSLEKRLIAANDPVDIAMRAAADNQAEVFEELSALSEDLAKFENELKKKHGVKDISELEDANITEVEKQFLFYSDAVERSEIDELIRVIEPLETLDESSTEISYALRNLPESPDGNLSFSEKAAQARLFYIFSEVERLGGDPIQVMKSAAEKIGAKHADYLDAELMVTDFARKLARYASPEGVSRQNQTHDETMGKTLARVEQPDLQEPVLVDKRADAPLLPPRGIDDPADAKVEAMTDALVGGERAESSSPELAAIDGAPVMFDPDNLQIDAKRFQFKEGGDEAGVTNR